MITAKQMTIEDKKLEDGKMKHMFLLVSLILVAGVALQAGATPYYQDAVLADSPSFYWTFDEESGNAVNYGSQSNADLRMDTSASRGTGTETPSGVSLGKAAIFSGAANETWSWGISGDTFTNYVIEMWIRDDDPNNASYVFQNGGATVNRPSAICGFEGAGIFEAFTSLGRTGTDGPDVSDGEWHHLVIGVDSTGGHTIYLNGAWHSNQPENIDEWRGNVLFTIGASYNDAAWLTGALDELAVYDVGAGNVATITADIADHYNAGPPTPGTLIYGK